MLLRELVNTNNPPPPKQEVGIKELMTFDPNQHLIQVGFLVLLEAATPPEGSCQ